jgi:phage terminase large subunit-like protein
VHHVGGLSELEDQMTTWTPDSNDSPDRLDALVWAITDLVLEPAKRGPRIVGGGLA